MTDQQRVTALLSTLREQKEMRLKGGIYNRVQVDMTYNSNHIERSTLTHDQTRYIFNAFHNVMAYFRTPINKQ